jgi:hypothetical protein
MLELDLGGCFRHAEHLREQIIRTDLSHIAQEAEKIISTQYQYSRWAI